MSLFNETWLSGMNTSWQMKNDCAVFPNRLIFKARVRKTFKFCLCFMNCTISLAVLQVNRTDSIHAWRILRHLTTWFFMVLLVEFRRLSRMNSEHAISLSYKRLCQDHHCSLKPQVSVAIVQQLLRKLRNGVQILNDVCQLLFHTWYEVSSLFQSRNAHSNFRVFRHDHWMNLASGNLDTFKCFGQCFVFQRLEISVLTRTVHILFMSFRLWITLRITSSHFLHGVPTATIELLNHFKLGR